MENQPIARLSFTCNRNWENMTVVKDGRFCNDCQKKVVDFTDKTNDEIAAYLMSSTTKVCGRFENSQLASSLPNPIWKRWISAAAMFVAVFMGIKEASAQTSVKNLKSDTLNMERSNQKNVANNNNSDDPTSFVGAVEVMPQFPGGEKALETFLNQNLIKPKDVTGRVITSFVVEKDGSLTDIKVLRGLNKKTDAEVIRVLKLSPKWQPSTQLGKVVKVAYTMPINF